MILVDTNIVVDAHDRRSRFRSSSSALIASAIAAGGAAINAVVLAELCAGQDDAEAIEDALRTEGFEILDVPVGAAVLCGRVYSQYKSTRRRSGGGKASPIPLPDFFIGAHAQLMGWPLATRDLERYRLYFPAVELIEP